jgi:stearoyl-CoA desaturase (delta-9 desaturase)
VDQEAGTVTPRSPAPETAEGWWSQHYWLPRFVYWGIHASCLLALVVGAPAPALWLFAITLVLRLLGITAAFHRYFAHRTYKTSRPFQLVLAVLGTMATQKGPLWWASHHRIHHRYSDQPGKDVHSPKEGFFYAHQGWIFDARWNTTHLDRIRDFAPYPELRWLNRWHILPPMALALFCLAVGGLPGVVWGFSISTVVLWHLTYSINSLAHRWGTRRYATSDTSRNNALLGLLTFGEGWHNNHHHYASSARQGFFWWEIDVTYYVLRALAAVGLIWDLKEPPAHVLRSETVADLPKAA